MAKKRSSTSKPQSAVKVKPQSNPEATATEKFFMDDALYASSSSSSPCEPLQLIDSFSEASGPRYRKIALNGMPKPDGKPQSKAETDEEKEETYVDAMDLSLRHDTSDIYIPMVGDALPFAIKRSVVAEVWSSSPGVWPQNAVDRPFGHGWTSGITANIQFSWKTPPTPSACPSEWPDPNYTIVTDETGATFRYVNTWTESGTLVFMPIPTNLNEMDNFLATLIIDNPSDPQAEWTFTFTKKYGTVLKFVPTSLEQEYISPPTPPGTTGQYSFQYYQYARLSQITDRYGRSLNFNGDTTSLIPTSITTDDDPVRTITITRVIDASGHRITQITDPNGNTITYNYVFFPVTLPYSKLHGPTWSVSFIITQLTSVERPEGQLIQYAYAGVVQEDTTPPDPFTPPIMQYNFLLYNLTSITDANSNTHIFNYRIDTSHRNFSNFGGWYTASGLPQIIESVILPDGLMSSFNVSETVPIQIVDGGMGANVVGYRVVKVTDAAGNMRTYQFDMPQLSSANEFLAYLMPPEGVQCRFYFLIRWQRMQLQHPTGVTETFMFNPEAAMALSSVVDYSGNTTSYLYEDGWSAASIIPWLTDEMANNSLFYTYYGDPTHQIDALGQEKAFEYENLTAPPAAQQILRIMKQITDEENRVTVYEIDPYYGLRLSETISDPEGNVVKLTLFEYMDSTFNGFMTKKTVVDGVAAGTDLVTTYVSDTNGYVLQESVGGISLTGTAATGSSTISGLASTAGLAVGMGVFGTGIPSGATVATIVSSSSITLSVSATATGTSSLTFTYPATIGMTGSTTNGSDTITGLASTTGLVVGMGVSGTGIPAGATVATIVSSSSISLSVPATASGSGISIVFTYPIICATTKYTHDANGNRTSVTDPNDNETYFAYDGLNRLIQVTNPDSTTREISYDPAGNKISEIDENGHVIIYTYDQLNRLTQKRRVMGVTLVETGNTTSGSTTISGLASTTGIEVGMAVVGRGIPVGATVATIVSSSSITLSIPAVITLTGNTINGSSTISGLASTTGLAVGMDVFGTGIPSGTTMAAIRPPPITVTGNTTNGSATILGLTSTSGIEAGMDVFGTGIPAGATVASVVSLSEITLSTAATVTNTGVPLEFQSEIILSAAATATNTGTSLAFKYSPLTLTGVTLTFAALNSAVDLITTYAYNGVNSKISETDPNGNTTTYAYDSIQRLIQITDALSQVWLHDFSGPNTGASAFASSDFKPTQITDPRGFRTWFVYDALYRTTSKNVEYEVTG